MKKKVEGTETAYKSNEDLANKVAKLKCEKKDLEFVLKIAFEYVDSRGANKHEDLARLNLVGQISKIGEV